MQSPFEELCEEVLHPLWTYWMFACHVPLVEAAFRCTPRGQRGHLSAPGRSSSVQVSVLQPSDQRRNQVWVSGGTPRGDCKFTPPEIEIAPVKMTSHPEYLVLWLRCTHPPTFLTKGQIIIQLIPAPVERGRQSPALQVNTVIAINEN